VDCDQDGKLLVPKVNHLETLRNSGTKEGPLSSSGPQPAVSRNSLCVGLRVIRGLPGLISSRLNLCPSGNHSI